ncbi:MAG: 2-octaprenyl-6-methoxyphenyl hydroxylase [Gammaproteobacteria bacterium]|nr:2-octaprenyl-6-methoxyphenyl hydroxylase [Gammaproteobacteria bacterium]
MNVQSLPVRPDHYDVVIAGGGMVGASLAVALQPSGLRTLLVESVPFGAASQPSFDERSTALSNGSRRILSAIGVWEEISQAGTPIRRIHVSDQGRFGFARLDAREQGVDALGHVMPNRALGAALWRRLGSTASCTVLAPARVYDVITAEHEVAVRVARDAAEDLQVTARLLVVADGVQSTLRTAMGIEATTWDYEQTAIITNVETQHDHGYVAYERFTPTGPLAVLPLAPRRCAVIWTLGAPEARQALELDDVQFLARLQDTFGFRLGRFVRVGRRASYPLALTRAQDRIGPRSVIVGNAAQGLHPIAGQGFNLGLRDVATLAEIIVSDAAHVGDPGPLQRYDSWRRRDRRSVIAFTDALVRLFGNPLLPVKLLRDLGLLLFDLTPPAKDAPGCLEYGCFGAPATPVARQRAVMSMQADVVIVGGGLVGACLATLLARNKAFAPERIVLVESRPPRQPAPSDDIDLRVSAVSRASERVLGACEVWRGIVADRVSPYERMRVWDAGSRVDGPAAIRFDCADVGEPDLGHIVENRRMQWALFESARHSGVTMVTGGVKALETAGGGRRAVLDDDQSIEAALTSRRWGRLRAAQLDGHWRHGPLARPRGRHARCHLARSSAHRVAALPAGGPDRLSALARWALVDRLEHLRSAGTAVDGTRRAAFLLCRRGGLGWCAGNHRELRATRPFSIAQRPRGALRVRKLLPDRRCRARGPSPGRPGREPGFSGQRGAGPGAAGGSQGGRGPGRSAGVARLRALAQG